MFNPLPEKVRFDVVDHFVSGNFVVMNVRYEAYMVVQGKHTAINIEEITVIHYWEGKMILLHDYPDLQAFSRQLTYQVTRTIILKVKFSQKSTPFIHTQPHHQFRSLW